MKNLFSWLEFIILLPFVLIGAIARIIFDSIITGWIIMTEFHILMKKERR